MHEFPVHGPARLFIEFGAGHITLEASDTDLVTVDLRGDDDAADALAAETAVEQRGEQVVIAVPRRTGFLRRAPRLRLRVTLPTGSRVDARSESAELDATGQLGDVQVKAGSGDTRIEHAHDVKVQSGSGDVSIGTAEGAATLAAGSGDVTVRAITGPGRVSTGSGDIRVEHAHGPLQANSGSGDVQLDAAESDVNANCVRRPGRTPGRPWPGQAQLCIGRRSRRRRRRHTGVGRRAHGVRQHRLGAVRR